MNNREALRHLLAAQKMRRQGFPNGQYIFMDASGAIYSNCGSIYTFPCSGVNDWEIYVPPAPKRKVKYAPVLYRRDSSGCLLHSTSMFATEQDARLFACDGFVRWLIDTPYAVEVEEL